MTVCLLAGICHAQQIRISGKVLEASTKQAAIAANVVLQTNDSTFVNGAATDNKGIFRIEKVAEGSYKLVISAIGFKKSVIDCKDFPNLSIWVRWNWKKPPNNWKK